MNQPLTVRRHHRDQTPAPGLTLPTRPLRLLGMVLAATTALSCGGDPEPTRPNVILITLDTVRADFLSTYGSTSGPTPALDALASEGTVFEHAMSASGLTPASHATILTGKFQYNHGVRVLHAGSGFELDDEHATLATAYKAAGYRTAAIHSAFPVSAHFGFDRGFDHFDSFDAKIGRKKGEDKVGWNVRKFQRRSDETTRRAIEWLDSAQGGDEPFFLWLHYWDPHDPVQLPPDGAVEELRYDPATGALQDATTQQYAIEVRYQDGNLGDLFGALQTKGLADETLVAVTADHGQGLEDGMRLHRWGMHRMLYREQLHVPFIIKGPGVPAGKRLADQVRTADVAPTLLALSGLPSLGDESNGVDGVSLQNRIQGEDGGDLVAYGEQINGYDHNAGMRKFRPDAAFMFMVSDGEWKLIWKPHLPQTSELFHVGVDPLETRNVIAENSDVVVRLLDDLAKRNPWVTAPFAGAADGSGDSSQAFSALGYAAADMEGSGDWWWTCPEHPEVHADARGRHGEDGCNRILIPLCNWTEPESDSK